MGYFVETMIPLLNNIDVGSLNYRISSSVKSYEEENFDRSMRKQSS